MEGSLLRAAFAHHVWASERLIGVCEDLGPRQLEVPVPGTYGSILSTLRHLVGSDAWYLETLGVDAPRIDEDAMDLADLRTAIGANGTIWSSFLSADLDPDAVLVEVDEDDGYRKDATIGVRLAQVIHHGTDHRSQVCTALSSLGMEPPDIDVWSFGLATGLVTEVYPPGWGPAAS